MNLLTIAFNRVKSIIGLNPFISKLETRLEIFNGLGIIIALFSTLPIINDAYSYETTELAGRISI